MAPCIRFIIYTIVMSIFPLGEAALLICQILADKYGKHKINDKTQKVFLYAVYITALMCSCFGYSLHASKNHPRWCAIYGLPPCFAVLGASKAFLYAFFLRRARKANVWNINGSKCAVYIFDYIGPIYIFVYWAFYVLCTALYFNGKVTDENHNGHIISYCLFDSWQWWFVIVSNSVDVFNCIATLILFLFPLCHSIRRLRINNDTVNERLSSKFMRTMRWNASLSFVATISSVSLLLSVPYVREYIWLFCGGDPFINSVCVFMMMASNRAFIRDSVSKHITMRSERHLTEAATNINLSLDFVASAGTTTCQPTIEPQQSVDSPPFCASYSCSIPHRNKNVSTPDLGWHHSF